MNRHNAAAHVSESQSFMKMRSVLSKENREGYETVHTNVNEQEADRIGIIYSTLAGFDPKGSVSVWQKKSTNDPNRFSYFRSHPKGKLSKISVRQLIPFRRYWLFILSETTLKKFTLSGGKRTVVNAALHP
jgi:hypothetical protein